MLTLGGIVPGLGRLNFFPGFTGFAGNTRSGTLTILAIFMWVTGVLGIVFGSVALVPIIAPTYSLPTINLIELAIMGIAPITIGILQIVIGVLIYTVRLSAYTGTIAISALTLVIGILNIVLALLFAFLNPPINPISADFTTLVVIIGAIFYGLFSVFVSILAFIILNSRTARAIFGRLRPRDLGAGGFSQGFQGAGFNPAFSGQFGGQFGGSPGQFGAGFPGTFGAGFPGQFGGGFTGFPSQFGGTQFGGQFGGSPGQFGAGFPGTFAPSFPANFPGQLPFIDPRFFR